MGPRFLIALVGASLVIGCGGSSPERTRMGTGGNQDGGLPDGSGGSAGGAAGGGADGGAGGGTGHVIYAGPSGLDTNPGTASSPFRTLKKAVSVAVSGDTIHLYDGTYQAGPALETWGYVLPANVTIVGQSTAGTILDGQAMSFDGIDAPSALTLQSLTIENFQNGVDLKTPSSTVALTDVAIADSANAGIYVEGPAAGSTVTIAGSKTAITQTAATTGVELALVANATVTMTGGSVTTGGDAFHFYGQCPGSALNISGTTITQTAHSGTYYAVYNFPPSPNTTPVAISIAGATIAGTVYDNDSTSTLTITGSTFTEVDDSGDGVDFYGKTLTISGNTTITMTASGSTPNTWRGVTYHSVAGYPSTMSLDHLTITGGGTAIIQDGFTGSAKLRNTTITMQADDGYSINGGQLDLGTTGDPGNNALGLPTSGGSTWFALDIFAAGTASVTVTSSQSTIGGSIPAAAVIAPTGTTYAQSGQVYLVSPGSTLTFE